MSTVPPPTQPGQQQQQSNPGAQQQQQGLPPTGLQQQLASLNSYYSQVQNARMPGGPMGMGGGGGFGFNVRQSQFGAAQAQGDQGQLPQDMEIGSSSLDAMARNLAQRYGMPIGRGRLVDDQGNFLMTPQQIADASGGSVTLGEAATQMNYISQAIARQQNEQQQQKGISALQAGLGQVQSRGRGSLSSMMSGYYEGIADLYANQEYEAADFSYYIQKEQLDIQSELQRRAEKLMKKQARGQFVAGVGLTAAGIFTGNIALAGTGATMAGGSAGQTGWF
jgi:hypothetical protein